MARKHALQKRFLVSEFAKLCAVQDSVKLLFPWNLKSELSFLKFGSKTISPSVLLVPSLAFPMMPHSQSKLFKDIICII